MNNCECNQFSGRWRAKMFHNVAPEWNLPHFYITRNPLIFQRKKRADSEGFWAGECHFGQVPAPDPCDFYDRWLCDDNCDENPSPARRSPNRGLGGKLLPRSSRPDWATMRRPPHGRSWQETG